jgi:cyclophilin family peptidyl-prolyl cis-trans isomerase
LPKTVFYVNFTVSNLHIPVTGDPGMPCLKGEPGSCFSPPPLSCKGKAKHGFCTGPANLCCPGQPEHVPKRNATTGTFVVEVHPNWAPLGAERFKKLVSVGFFSQCRFFRVVQNFMAQFGINGDPKIAKEWKISKLKDDRVKVHNDEGYLSFATSGPNSRDTQMFINLSNNRDLDGQNFAPFARVVKGMDVVKQLYSGYGEIPQKHWKTIESEGNSFLRKVFPQLSYIKSARVVPKPKGLKSNSL